MRICEGFLSVALVSSQMLASFRITKAVSTERLDQLSAL